MIYILIENYDEGLELESVKDFDALALYLRDMAASGRRCERIKHIIKGKEIPLAVVKSICHLQ